MSLKFDDSIKNKFENFYVGLVILSNIANKSNFSISDLRDSIFNEIKSKYDLDNLKDEPTFRVNRDFFWKIGIDPTKKRPASEALIRRLLADKPIPAINIFVDLYNLISIKYEIAIAGFDADKLTGDILMRNSINGEEFKGIGMKKPLILTGKEIILEDKDIIAIYPYRDADYSKLMPETKNIILLTCGVPGYPEDKIQAATIDLLKTFKKYIGGEGSYKIYSIKNSSS